MTSIKPTSTTPASTPAGSTKRTPDAEKTSAKKDAPESGSQAGEGAKLLKDTDRSERAPAAAAAREGADGGVEALGTETAAPVKRGDSGEKTRDLQQRLNEIAGEKLETDGKFGPRTEGALRRFQQSRGLEVSGELDAATAAAIEARAAATQSPGEPIARGAKGERVAQLQRELVEAGAKIKVDGVFGPRTEAAVQAYQTSRELEGQGVADERTLISLAAKVPEVRKLVMKAAAATGGTGAAGASGTAAAGKNISLSGLTQRASEVVALANQFGLRLTSGKRSGGVKGSDHPIGKGVDVSNGSRPTAEMQAFADAIRGQEGIKYVIYNNKIASASNNWAWRAYKYPGGPATGASARHENHVHVSVK